MADLAETDSPRMGTLAFGTITYGYDNLDRLTNETTPQGSVSYTYDAAGRRTSMTVAGHPTVNCAYDNADRLTQITQGSSTVTIVYDASGRRTSVTLPNGGVTEYGYDLASQLTRLTYKQGQTVLGDLIYEYDANGARTRVAGSFARSISPQPLTAATYNAANQQLTFGSQTLSYDLNGNLTTDSTNTYTWDARNRLVSTSGPSVSASFQYDAAGRRSTKTINGNITSFLYDGTNITQEQSSQTGNANIFSGGIDEIFTRGDLSGSFSPMADGLGSSLSLTDASGTLQTEYAYGAFGSSASTGAASNNSSQYTGRENDGTGLYYYRARYYSPERQRFLSEDPIEFEGGDINLYAYVANSPTNLIDSIGLSAVTKVARIAKLLFGGGMKVEKGIGFKDASQVVKGGGDVIADNRKLAGEIARDAGGGKRPIHDLPHGPVEDGFRPHYHPAGRPGGHVFYGIGAILAPNSLMLSGRSCTTNAQFASAVAWDLASGMDPTGLTDAINWGVGLD